MTAHAEGMVLQLLVIVDVNGFLRTRFGAADVELSGQKRIRPKREATASSTRCDMTLNVWSDPACAVCGVGCSVGG